MGEGRTNDKGWTNGRKLDQGVRTADKGRCTVRNACLNEEEDISLPSVGQTKPLNKCPGFLLKEPESNIV